MIRSKESCNPSRKLTSDIRFPLVQYQFLSLTTSFKSACSGFNRGTKSSNGSRGDGLTDDIGSPIILPSRPPRVSSVTTALTVYSAGVACTVAPSNNSSLGVLCEEETTPEEKVLVNVPRELDEVDLLLSLVHRWPFLCRGWIGSS